MMPDDILENVKREQEVADRPGKTSPTPVPPALHEFSKAPYSLAAPKKASKPKSETDTSLEWNAQQRKVAEQQ
jgi:hypothetical protein